MAEDPKSGIEPQKSRVDINLRTRSLIPAEFKRGDHVKVAICEKGVWTAVRMEVVKADFRDGEWRYEVRRSGAGNRWVWESDLDSWD